MTKDEYQNTKNGVKQSYNIAAGNYHRLFKDELTDHLYDRQVLEHFASLLPPGAKICDMGCGPAAHIGGYLYEKGHDVEGLDFSASCIAKARASYPDMQFHMLDMTDSGLPDASFDGIISFYSLFHVPKEFQFEAIDEFARLLKPQGKLLLMNHKGTLTQTFTEMWDKKELTLFANFSTEEEMKSLVGRRFDILSMETKKSYAGFPEERIIMLANKRA